MVRVKTSVSTNSCATHKTACPRERKIELIAKIISRVVSVVNSLWVRLRVGKCGPGLTAQFPIQLTAPRSAQLGRDVYLCGNAWLNCEANAARGTTLKIGDRVYLGRFLHINARQSVIIEDDVLISDRVFITDYHHGTKDLDAPIIQQPLTPGRPVCIRRGAWIGEGAAIMPGVTIGIRAVVGANAVVTRDVPDGAVARGVPARIYSRADGKPHSSGTSGGS